LVVNVACTKRRSWPAATMLAGIAFLPSKPGTISLLPEEMQRQVVGTPSYGSFLTSTNQLDPSLSLQFNTSPEAQSATQGSDPFVVGFVSGAVLTPDNALGLGGGATGFAPTIISGAGVQAACEELAGQLQSAAKYWNGQTISGMPRLLAANSMAASAGGNSTNLSPEGRAGAWCRSPPIPFAESSPLASRAFWQPIAVVAFGIIVFWLSRGIRLPS
jgi:hypothetical protein